MAQFVAHIVAQFVAQFVAHIVAYLDDAAGRSDRPHHRLARCLLDAAMTLLLKQDAQILLGFGVIGLNAHDLAKRR